MADTKALPVFAFLDCEVQLAELRAFFNERLSTQLDPKGPTDVATNLREVVTECGRLAKGGVSPPEADMLLSSIGSLVVMVDEKRAADVVRAFCAAVNAQSFRGQGQGSMAGAAFRSVSNLFWAFARLPAAAQPVLTTLVELAGEARLTGELDLRAATLKQYAKDWRLSVSELRDLLRGAHQALLADEKADAAAGLMLELLSTYTATEDAAAAAEDARECVRVAIVDPATHSFDHLLRLAPVAALEKSRPQLYQALQLFAHGTVDDFVALVAKHPTLVKEELNVDEAVLLKKLRLLTLMSLAHEEGGTGGGGGGAVGGGAATTLKLAAVAKALHFKSGDEDELLEKFIIDAIHEGAIKGRLNAVQGTLSIWWAEQRRFERNEWIQIQKRIRALLVDVKGAHQRLVETNKTIEHDAALEKMAAA